MTVANANRLPHFSNKDTLVDAAWKLRVLAFRTLTEAGKFFGYAHTTISRYEHEDILPKEGYLACLAKRIIDRLKAEEGGVEDEQEQLLQGLNLVFVNSGREPFRDWNDLCSIADKFLTRRRTQPTRAL